MTSANPCSTFRTFSAEERSEENWRGREHSIFLGSMRRVSQLGRGHWSKKKRGGFATGIERTRCIKNVSMEREQLGARSEDADRGAAFAYETMGVLA